MALVQFGGGVSQIRGSIGGTVFSRGAGGAIARARTKPINPRSPLQNVRRSNHAYLTTYWSLTLTEQQRVDWRDYAHSTTWTNRLGQTIQINGLAAFVRINSLILLAGLPVVPAAPTATGHAGGVTISFAAQNDTKKFQLDEPGGAFDKDADGHTLYLFSGFPTEAGRIATPKGFRFLQTVDGDSVTPETFPLEVDAPYTMAEGQLLTMRAMFVDDHYRSSGPYFATATAAPST